MENLSLLIDYELNFFRIRHYIQAYGKLEDKDDYIVWSLNNLKISYCYSTVDEILSADSFEFCYNHKSYGYDCKNGNLNNLKEILIDINKKQEIRRLLHINLNKNQLYFAK